MPKPIPVGRTDVNGQVEVTKKTLMGILKKTRSDRKGAWAEKHPRVLWVYRITERTPMRETPFTLTYSYEVMLPVEISFPTYRMQHFEHNFNDERLEEQL